MESGKGGTRWDHSPEITDHKPWDRDQQFFKGSGIKLSIPETRNVTFVTLFDSRIINLGTTKMSYGL